ncbi:DUF397 domain-containing protein [Streptomyces sp. NPDC005209]|uniref:DUF397 domain-containing protein n=1 Tax=Streptomyces sp. NPDC005209 TaxID=3156715 RepID=UPI0033A9156C
MSQPPARVVWRKSSYSSDYTGNCVEVAALGASVGIRDSKQSRGPVLTVPREAFAVFVAHAVQDA